MTRSFSCTTASWIRCGPSGRRFSERTTRTRARTAPREEGGPAGHNIDDQLKPRERTIRQVLDITEGGCSSEQPPSQPQLLEIAAWIKPSSPFMAERSPFMAD